MHQAELKETAEKLSAICEVFETNSMCGDECPFHYYEGSKECCHLVRTMEELRKLCSEN